MDDIDNRQQDDDKNAADYKPKSGAPENIEAMHSLKLEDISPRTTKESLTAEFQVFGDLGDVYVPMKMGTMIPRGFAFVRFINRDDMEAALQSMDGKIIDGSEVKITEAQQRPRYDPQQSMERRRLFMRGGRGGGGGYGYRRDDYRNDYRDRGYDQRDSGYNRGGYDNYDRRGGGGGYSAGRSDYRDDYRSGRSNYREEYRAGGSSHGRGEYDRRERDRSRSR